MSPKRKVAKPRRRSGKRQRQWSTFTVAERARQLHDLPEQLPIPANEKHRTRKGSVGMGEFSTWIYRFLEETPDAEDGAALRVVADRLSRYQSAVAALNEADYQGAREMLEAIVSEYPSDKMAALNLAFAEIETDDGDKALHRLEELADDFPGDGRHAVLRSRALVRSDRRDEAIKLLWDSHEAKQNDIQIVGELQRHGEMIPVQFVVGAPMATRYMPRSEFEANAEKRAAQLVESEEHERLVTLVERLVEGGRPELALRMADLGVEAQPEHARLQRLRSLALVNLGRHDESIEAANKALELGPDSSRSNAALGRALREKGDMEAARQALGEAVRLDHENVDAFEQLILTFPEEERMAQAEQLAGDHPKSWIPGKLIGDLLFAKGETEEALAKHYAAWRAGDHDDSLTMLLHDLGQLGRIEEAVAEIGKVQHLNRRNGNARWNSANLLLEGGRGRAAADVLRSMVEDDRLSPELRFAANRLLGQVAPRKR